MRRSVSNSQRSGKYPRENWDAKDAQKHCARLLGTQFSHVAFHVRKASKEQKSAKTDVVSPFLATGGVRERSERAPGGGPGRVREGSEKCFERLRCRIISVVCPNRARDFKKVCEPLEEWADFGAELANYRQLLTMLVAACFQRQARWFSAVLQNHCACAESSFSPRLCRKWLLKVENGPGNRVLSCGSAFSLCLCSKTSARRFGSQRNPQSPAVRIVLSMH